MSTRAMNGPESRANGGGRSSGARAARLVSLLGAAFLAGCATPAERSPPRLAITMDDLPVHGVLPRGETRAEVAERIVAALRTAGVPGVYGFVNASALESEPALAAVLETWRRAGYPLGNHGWSHRNLNDLNADEFAAEVVRNEPALERFAPGDDWRWFRYPFLAEGDDAAKRAAARNVLARRKYRIAAVTMDFSDWQWSDAYARCRDANDTRGLAALERAYLDAVGESISRSRTLSRALHGRDIPYVLLTHLSAFNARMMPRVLELYRRQGFRFVTLPSAQRDAAYRADTDPRRAADPPSLEAEAAARGLPVPERVDRTAFLAAACR